MNSVAKDNYLVDECDIGRRCQVSDKSSSTDKVKEMERHLVMLLDSARGDFRAQDSEAMIAEQITLLIRAVVADELSKRGE